MSISLGVPREKAAGETRVAIVPEVAKRLIKNGFNVCVEEGAGRNAHFSDADYSNNGATVCDRSTALGSDVVVGVQAIEDEEIPKLKSGSVYVAFIQPLDNPQYARKLAGSGVTSLAMELVPRISRAQKMDALSAMANIGGYKAVLDAATILPRFFPLLTTAAGTVKPANVLVLGAGVAGLQAIATAKRLGARVSAYDIRDAVKEQVESLGASFVELDFGISGMEDKSGYAKALTQEKAEKQVQLLVPIIAKSDVVVTTALIPGRPAPLLITEEAVRGMKGGSVIVDMAAANGGNCALTERGSTVRKHGVTIIGNVNYPATMPVHASELYGRTLSELVRSVVGEDGEINIDMEDEVIVGSCVTHGGSVVHERVKSILGS